MCHSPRQFSFIPRFKNGTNMLKVVFVSVLSIVIGVRCAEYSSNYYCADLNPQSHVDIEQLMGMWYGVEIINHKQEEDLIEPKYSETCPILFFSEDRTPVTSISPLHKDYNYQQTYGQLYPHGYPDRNYNAKNDDLSTDDTYADQLNPAYQQPMNEDMSDMLSQYERQQNYQRTASGGGYMNRGRMTATEYLRRRYHDMRRLRLLWDENGRNTEYTMRYNVSTAGFWMSSGPQNGSALEPLYNHFAGTVQVLKAVGNHMVLIFCHQLPERQLYTILLSRVPKLSKQEIHGVHNLLNRKGLSTSNVKRVCAHSGVNRTAISPTFTTICIMLFFWKYYY